MKRKIFYIEDEPFLGKIVKDTLEKEDFEVIWETDGAKVLGRLNNFSPDICVLDIMLPNVDGYTLCRQIKKMLPSLPIIFLTAKIDTIDLVKGFDAGGNDYMRKPFSIEELIVRIGYHIKNSESNAGTDLHQSLPEVIRLGKFSVHMKTFELEGPSETIRLSYRDMEVLEMLISNINHVTDRKELLLKVWGDDSYFNSRTLDVYIRKLRKYFREDPYIEIVTLKAKGYLFRVPE